MQGVHSNYDIDLFKELLSQIADALNLDKHNINIKAHASYRRSHSLLAFNNGWH